MKLAANTMMRARGGPNGATAAAGVVGGTTTMTRTFCEGRSWQPNSSLVNNTSNLVERSQSVNDSFGGSLVGFDVHGKEKIRAHKTSRPLFRRGGLEKRFRNGKEAANLLLSEAKRRDGNNHHFLQVCKRVMEDLAPVFDRNPEYAWAAKHMLEPERTITFRVPWVDDMSVPRINRGWRIQYSSSLGPYAGGITFNENLDESALKALAFDQIFQSSLTGLQIGAARGGSDFSPAGKSDSEIRAFCRSFMVGLAPYIGPQRDVPTGDIGCGEREIGFMYGRYKRMTGESNAAMGGKVIGWGNDYDPKHNAEDNRRGPINREVATGRGLVKIAEMALKEKGESVEGKRCVVSGSGNIALEVARQLIERGAVPLTLSDDAGFVVEKGGFTREMLDKVDFAKTVNPKGYGRRMSEYVKYSSSARFYPNSHSVDVPSLWNFPCDIAFACDRGQIIHSRDAQNLVENGCQGVFEGVMDRPASPSAIQIFERSNCAFVPGKAGSAGGLAVTGLMVTQLGAVPLSYDIETEFDKIIAHVYERCVSSAEEYGMSGNVNAGANISAFVKVADAMFEQGAV
eukprot:g916.t1